MKTTLIRITRVVLVVILTFSGLMIYANNSYTVDVNKTTPEKTIRDYFKFPQVLLPSTLTKESSVGKVEVLFTTDTTGKVNFVFAKTDVTELKKEIESQFMTLNLNGVRSEVVHSVTLNFKKI